MKKTALVLLLFLLPGCNNHKNKDTILKVPRFEALKIANDEFLIIGKDLDKKCNDFKFQIIMSFFFVDNQEYDKLDLTVWGSKFNFVNDSTWKVDVNFIDSITSSGRVQVNHFLSSEDKGFSGRQKNSSRYSKSSFKKFIALLGKNQIDYTVMIGINEISGKMRDLKTGEKVPLFGYYVLNSTIRGNTIKDTDNLEFVRMMK